MVWRRLEAVYLALQKEVSCSRALAVSGKCRLGKRAHMHEISPSQIVRLQASDLEAEISESDVFMLEDGQKAVQWCFEEEKFRGLMEGLKGRGKVHIETLRPLECIEA